MLMDECSLLKFVFVCNKYRNLTGFTLVCICDDEFDELFILS